MGLERRFFHWITRYAVNELAAEGSISFTTEKTDIYEAHFYWPVRHRYPRRQIRQILGLINEFSDPSFTRALGHHGEALVDAGFARIGFRILQSKVQEVDGKRWLESNHDIDRLVARDGVRYGVEIKNQLGYIEQAANLHHLHARLPCARRQLRIYDAVTEVQSSPTLSFWRTKNSVIALAEAAKN